MYTKLVFCCNNKHFKISSTVPLRSQPITYTNNNFSYQIPYFSMILPILECISELIPSPVQPNKLRPPAYASTSDAPTGVPAKSPNCFAACALSPFPTGVPGAKTSLPMMAKLFSVNSCKSIRSK